VDFNGFRRDSTGFSVAAGASLAFPGWLAGELAVGHMMRTMPTRSCLRPLDTLSMLRWPAGQPSRPPSCSPPRRKFAETTIPGLSGILQRDAIVQVAQQLDPQRAATFRTGYGQDLFFGSPRVDNRFFVSAGLTWKVSRMLQFNAELRQEWLHSNVLVRQQHGDGRHRRRSHPVLNAIPAFAADSPSKRGNNHP
jgi:hypothetical protein